MLSMSSSRLVNVACTNYLYSLQSNEPPTVEGVTKLHLVFLQVWAHIVTSL